MKKISAILILFSLGLNCNKQGTSLAERSFNIDFKYGVGALNEMNTFDNQFTKDLILDGTITVALVLSDNELAEIENKLLQIVFFSYPDTFIVQTSCAVVSYIEPHQTYIFMVEHESAFKQLFWSDAIVTTVEDPKVVQLREAIAFIKAIIQAKPEYQKLPAASGGYL